MSSPGFRPGHHQRLATVIHTRPYVKGAIVRALMDEGYSVTEQPAGVDAADLILDLMPNIVIVSIDPDEEPWPIGPGLAGAIRNLPVIALVPDAARQVDRVLAEFGTTYIRDSDVAEMFVAQVRALSRLEPEQTPEEGLPAVAAVGDLEVDLTRMRATYAGHQLDLTPAATSILGCLAHESGRIVAPRDLLEQALHRSYKESDARVVARQYIRRIRRAMEAAGAPPNMVVNVRGFGYLIEPTAEPHPTMLN